MLTSYGYMGLHFGPLAHSGPTLERSCQSRHSECINLWCMSRQTQLGTKARQNIWSLADKQFIFVVNELRLWFAGLN